MDNITYAPFDSLCLGAKFRYDSRKHNPNGPLRVWDGPFRVWVKIGHNEIAHWDEDNLTTKWIGQQICCFSDGDDPADLLEEVELVDQGIRS